LADKADKEEDKGVARVKKAVKGRDKAREEASSEPSPE